MNKNIWRRNPQFTSKIECLEIGWARIKDGLINILSNGRYESGYSADAIEKCILAGIERRRKERGIQNKT